MSSPAGGGGGGEGGGGERGGGIGPCYCSLLLVKTEQNT